MLRRPFVEICATGTTRLRVGVALRTIPISIGFHIRVARPSPLVVPKASEGSSDFQNLRTREVRKW